MLSELALRSGLKSGNIFVNTLQILSYLKEYCPDAKAFLQLREHIQCPITVMGVEESLIRRKI